MAGANLVELYKQFNLEPVDPEKERARQASLARDQARERPKRRQARVGMDEALRTSGGTALGPRFALVVVGLTDYRRLRPTTRLFFGMMLWSYQPGRVWRRTARGLGSSVGLEARTCERATAELRKFGYLARYGGGWVCPPIEMGLPDEQRAWKIQLSFDFVPDWETVNPAAARYLGLVRPGGGRLTNPAM